MEAEPPSSTLRAGVQVWLQVEPADADVPPLIDLVLERYAAHPSVIGFGITPPTSTGSTLRWSKSGRDNERRDAAARR